MQADYKKQNERGFTLIELIVVIVVISIIAAIAISRFQAAIMPSNEASTVSAVKLIANSEVSFRGSSATFGSLEDLINANMIDSTFRDSDGDPNTGVRNGFSYKLTITGENFVISAIPTSTGMFGTGRRRVGADNTGRVARDDNNLTTQYTDSSELSSGTSVPIDTE